MILAVEEVTGKPSSAPKHDDPPSPPKPDPELNSLVESVTTVDPKEFPPSATYSLKSLENVTCLQAQFAVQFTVVVTDGKTNETQYLSIREATVLNPLGCPENMNNATELELKLIFNKTFSATFFFKRENPGIDKESQWLDKIKLVFTDLFGKCVVTAFIEKFLK